MKGPKKVRPQRERDVLVKKRFARCENVIAAELIAHTEFLS
jgi:hypothetical protein